MGLKFCERLDCVKPYHIEELGIGIYSMEELCYIIYENPLLVIENFVNENLLEFISAQLLQGMLRVNIERMLAEHAGDEDVLCYILEYSDFYTGQEAGRFKALLVSLKKLHKSEYLKAKADYMFALGKYGRAAAYYKQITRLEKDTVLNDRMLGSVYNNLGSSYANMFLYKKAYSSYDKAYGLLGDTGIIKRIYRLHLMEPGLEIKDIHMSILSETEKDELNEEFEALNYRVIESERIRQVDEVFAKDSVRRNRLALEMIGAWKQEYRNMI